MQLASVSKLFKLLGDPTRLRMLRLLAGTELSVMELAEVTQLAQSRVSNHLKLLRDEGIVHERREGAWRHYRVETDRLPNGTGELWAAIGASWEGDDQGLADEARLRDVLARRHARDGRFFDAIAGEWDDVRAELFGDSIARQILRAFVPSNFVVADIGAGTGYLFEIFGDRPRRIVAIDNNAAMLAVARRKVASLGLKNVVFREGDAHKPPLKRNEADLVTFLMVLHHLEDPAAAVASAARGLKPGGRMLVVDFVRHQATWLRDTMQHRHLGFDRETIAASCEAAGMALRDWSVLPGKRWVTPEGRKVRVPDGFMALAEKPPASPATHRRND